jgi:thiamine-monophosphate kinase
MDLRELGERDAISRFQGIIGGTTDLGMGEDDCAVVSLGDDRLLLASTDMVLETSHMLPGVRPGMIGQFAVEIAVSDVAAMGGSPIGVLCGYAMPSHTDIYWLEKVTTGMAETAEALGTSVLGGDTKSSPEPTIAVTALGLVDGGNCLFRSGAKKGDALLLTGPVGGPAMGYSMERYPEGKLKDPALELVYGVRARKMAGLALAASEHAHACIDLSDGFAPCLHQLLGSSNKGAEVRWNNIPLADGLEEFAFEWGKDLREMALHWGGEYELLAAIDPDGVEPLVKDLGRLGLEPAIVGHVIEGQQTIIIDDSGRGVLKPDGFDHFQV